jgi:hypothetical protein
MLIGGNFNKKAREFLKELALMSNYAAGERVEVGEILHQVDLEKTELKTMMEYLESLDYLRIETIGGKFLYGHVSITKKGLNKVKND